MIRYSEALEILLSQAVFSSESRSSLESMGFVSAEEVTSSVSLPPFANSAMDGFAVREEDLASATATNPITLTVEGSTFAGDDPEKGQAGAWEIMTGAAVPPAYDSVVKVEDVNILSQTETGRPIKVQFTAPVERHNNIRDAGEDMKPGDILFPSGRLITPIEKMVLAAIGKSHVQVRPKIRATVLSTGKELVDDPATPLKPGQIRNSNGPYLRAALGELPVMAQYGGVIQDEEKIFEEMVRKAVETSDILLSTGAVSAGRHDFIPDSLRKLGAEILFHKVKIRPGKPILYARFPNGTHYFGLPGNPVSAIVGLRFFIIPLLRHLLGMAPEPPVQARLSTPFVKKKGFQFFLKARLSIGSDGVAEVKILDGQQSFKIKPLLKANGWAMIPDESEELSAGQKIAFFPLTPGGTEL